MPVFIALLRGVNLAKNNRMKMETLRAVCESLKLRDVQTYIQSRKHCISRQGKRIRRSWRRESSLRLKRNLRIPSAGNSTHRGGMEGCHFARNPYASRSDIEPGRLLVHFLAGDPGEGRAGKSTEGGSAGARSNSMSSSASFTFYFSGMVWRGPNLSFRPWSALSRSPAADVNWNSVLKLLEMAETLERAE